MQININDLCRDSILAAPIALDLALFSDFAFGWMNYPMPITYNYLRLESIFSV